MAGIVAATVVGNPGSDPGPENAPVTATAVPTAAPPIETSAIQPVWDPRDVLDLPTGNVLLPLDLVPGASGDVSGARILALVDDGQGLWVVDDGERWQRYDYPEELPPDSDSALSPDGTHVFVTGRTGLWWRATAGGGWQETDYPDGIDAQSGVGVVAVGDSVAYLRQAERSWRADVDLGGVQESSPAPPAPAVPASDGTFVAFDVTRSPFHRTIDVYRDGQRTRVVADALDYLESPVADAASLAATRTASTYNEPRIGTDKDGLLALWREDLRTRAYLPVLDENGRRPPARRLAGSARGR